MITVKGRIIYFIRGRDGDGCAEFIFRSDADKQYPRFTALCMGKIPDAVPGVPLLAEFMVDDRTGILTTDARDLRTFMALRKECREQLRNQVSYVCIDFRDEGYAQSVLTKVKGISEKTAGRILQAAGGNLLNLSGHWDDTGFWKKLKGSGRYLPELKETVGSLIGKEQLFRKYSRYGIGYPQIDLLSGMYGMEAEARLLSNPYAVLPKLDLDFQVADNLAKDTGFSYLDEKRIRAMIRHVLYRNEENGNTCMSQTGFYLACAAMHKMSAWGNRVVSPYVFLSTLMDMNDINYEAGKTGLMKTWERETDIACQIRRLVSAPSDLHTGNEVFEGLRDKYNEDQIMFLKTFDKNSVTLLLGRGGTGKTHVICGAIDLLKRHCPDAEIRLCAPTARAAGVLKEHSGYPSSTIHILLGLNPHTMEDETALEQLEAQLVVVDEMSMVDTELMYYLLRSVKSGTKLILSGDPNQLESVGCGSVLGDLIQSGVVPGVTLHKIMRQESGSPIVENCSRVLSGNGCLTQNRYFHIRQCQTEQEAVAYLKSCYTGDKHDIQILTTTKKGPVGTEALNRLFDNPSQEGVWFHNEHFKPGDKVIFTRNNYGMGYCNGDIGFIESILPLITVRKQGEDGTIEIDKECAADMEHADAITIHKSQGSEYQKVYILLPESPRSLLTRNMVNTAISRAKKNVEQIIIGNALKVAVSNRFKKERVTRLRELLENVRQTGQEELNKKPEKQEGC